MEPHTAFGGELEAVPKQVVQHLQRLNCTWEHLLADVQLLQSLFPICPSRHVTRGSATICLMVYHKASRLPMLGACVAGWLRLAWAGLGWPGLGWA